MKNKKLGQMCDFCKQPAVYDTQTKMGPWAFVCERHFERYSTQVEGLYSRLKAVVAEDKYCWMCERVKAITDFYEYTDARGVSRYRNECKECNLRERKLRSFRK